MGPCALPLAHLRAGSWFAPWAEHYTLHDEGTESSTPLTQAPKGKRLQGDRSGNVQAQWRATQDLAVGCAQPSPRQRRNASKGLETYPHISSVQEWRQIVGKELQANIDHFHLVQDLFQLVESQAFADLGQQPVPRPSWVPKGVFHN